MKLSQKKVGALLSYVSEAIRILTALIYFLLAWIIRLLLTAGMDRISPRREGGKTR